MILKYCVNLDNSCQKSDYNILYAFWAWGRWLYNLIKIKLIQTEGETWQKQMLVLLLIWICWSGSRQRTKTKKHGGTSRREAEAEERGAERVSAWRPVMSSAGGNRSLWAHPVQSQPPFLSLRQTKHLRWALCVCVIPLTYTADPGSGLCR